MKFHIDKKILDSTLEIVSKYTDSINTLYAFRCVLVDVNEEKIVFSASNGQISIIKSVDVDDVNIKIENSGKFLIQANIFRNIIKKLNNTITISADFSNTIEIVQGNSNYTLTTNPVNTFPNIEQIVQPKKFEINTAEFKKAIKCVSFAASSGEVGMIYEAINFKYDNKKIILAATDTHRLAVYKMKLKSELLENFDMSILAKDVKELIPNDAPKKITMFYNKIKVGIEYKNTIIISRIIDMPYRDIEGLLNIENAYTIKINKNVLTDLMNKIWIGNDKQYRVEIKINKDKLTLYNRLEEIGTGEASTNKFSLDGKAIDFEFNYNFLKDAISVYDDDLVIIIDSNIRKILIVSPSNTNTHQLMTPFQR